MTSRLDHPSDVGRSPTRLLVTLLLLLAASGCNLTLDLGEYPYQGGPDVEDVSTDSLDSIDGADTMDMSSDDVFDAQQDTFDATDVEPEDRPVLIFTEVMPDSSVEGGASSVEYGEFVEIKNIGKVPADPRRIIIEFEDADRRIAVDPFPSDEREQQVLDELQPIEPGEYFVFVRKDTDYYRITEGLEAGTFYEYGRWNNEQLPLSNSERTLTLFYRFSDFEAFVTDKIEWVSRSLIDPSLQTPTNREIREDVALGVQEISESQSGNDSPANWCYHAETLPDSPVKASPGGPTPATCTVD